MAVRSKNKLDLDFSNVPIEGEAIEINTPNFQESVEKLNLNIMDELLKGNAIYWSTAKKLKDLVREEKNFIWDHIELSRYDNPERDTGEKPFDMNDTIAPNVGLAKQLYIIPNCTLDHPFFTIKYNCHEKPNSSTMRYWKEGDLRSNGEGWKRPNENTFRFTVSLPLVISAKDVTFQMEISEFDKTLSHQRAYADMMKLTDVPLPGKWDRCFIYERTRVDKKKTDGLKKFKMFQFFKQFNGGVLVKSMQCSSYQLYVPLTIQDKCIKSLAIRFESPANHRKFVAGIETSEDDMSKYEIIDKPKTKLEKTNDYLKEKKENANDYLKEKKENIKNRFSSMFQYTTN